MIALLSYLAYISSRSVTCVSSFVYTFSVHVDVHPYITLRCWKLSSIMSRRRANYTVGTYVMARWPDSALYYRAIIKSVGRSTVDVEFEDGSEFEIPDNHCRVSSYVNGLLYPNWHLHLITH